MSIQPKKVLHLVHGRKSKKKVIKGQYAEHKVTESPGAGPSSLQTKDKEVKTRARSVKRAFVED